MTEHATMEPDTAEHSAAASSHASPDFDRQEISNFGKDDAHAVTVIGKMLVLFFFYSLLVMAGVAGLTIWGVGKSPAAPDHGHRADTAEF